MSPLGSKRQPISLDGDDEELLRPKKSARQGPQVSRKRRSTTDIDASDSSETLRNESEDEAQDFIDLSTPHNGASTMGTSLPSSPIRFSSDDYMDDQQLEEFLLRMKINAENEASPSSRKQTQQSETIIHQYEFDGGIYRTGKSVELRDGTFLRVKTIVKVGDRIILRGWHFKRCESMDGIFPRRTNEICWNVDLLDDGTVMIREFPLTEVKRFRMIRMTNHQYQDMSYKTMGLSTNASEGFLFCRFKNVKIWKASAPPKELSRPLEEAVISLTPGETDRGYEIESRRLREKWRGTITGSSSPARNNHTSVLIDVSSDHTSISSAIKKYTFGDGFCGAGGVSCGARLAGLEISWGFDKSEHAMGSYRRNYHDAMCETSEIADFLTNSSENIMVDVIHCSPPCQTFSPAKTVACANDDANEACIFSVRQVIEKGKPRVFTMEETSGLKERHQEFLYATIHSFLDLGYSARWKLVDCSSYGVPQKRKRLVVIASGPGETLPPFPMPTHGPPASGLRPYNTIGSIISRIPRNADNHDPNTVRRFNPPKLPYPPDSLAKTITCGGGENYHPSGKRGFTTREYASLQTFPESYKFGKTEVRKQIGNAVPPMLAKALYREIIKSLEQTDGFR